jgi:hypothetical protein
MFWAVDEETKAELRCHKFIENFRPEMMNEPTSADGRQVILVLDGQQCQRQSKSEPKGSAKCCHFGVGMIAA